MTSMHKSMGGWVGGVWGRGWNPQKPGYICVQ